VLQEKNEFFVTRCDGKQQVAKLPFNGPGAALRMGLGSSALHQSSSLSLEQRTFVQ
jgi:hypothetical protein